ncbi:YfiR family protein [Vibrio alfacsensis]|uniref:YfiR family protein n=1 Tax=Vibrio alfacsensis TaxID=1074311 RepID=UPI0040676C38
MKHLLIMIALLLTPLQVGAAEIAHKLAFVNKSLPFVQWPETKSDIGFCAVVSDEQWPEFSPLNNLSVRGKAISVERMKRGNSIASCDVLYLGDISALELQYWSQQMAQLPIYSVCESWRCAREDVMLGLGVEDDRLYFEFNARVMKRAGLQIDSRFLRLARTLY